MQYLIIALESRPVVPYLPQVKDFYDKSPVRTSGLREIQNVLKEPILQLLEVEDGVQPGKAYQVSEDSMGGGANLPRGRRLPTCHGEDDIKGFTVLVEGNGLGHRCWDRVTREGGRDTDAGTQSQEEEVGTQMLGPSHKRRSGHRCWDPVTRGGGGRDTDAWTQSQEEEVGTQMLGPSHKRWRSGHRCWDPVTRGGGRDTDAGTQSQEEEVGTQMLGPSHKRRRSGHRCWDPVTRGGAGTQSQEEEVGTQMLGPSHKRRRSGHRCWDPVTRGGGRDTDAGTQSQEEESQEEVGTQMLGPSHKRRRSGHRCWDPVTRGGGRDTGAGTQSQEEEVGTQMLGPSHKRMRSGHRWWDPVTRGGGRDTDAGTQSQEEEVGTQNVLKELKLLEMKDVRWMWQERAEQLLPNQEPAVIMHVWSSKQRSETNVILECSAIKNPQPVITWEKYGGILLPGRYRQIYANNGLNALQPDGLKVLMLKVSEPPSIVVKECEVNVSLGRLIKLVCAVSGRPEPVVTWYHNGKFLRDFAGPSVFDSYQNVTKTLDNLIEANQTSAGQKSKPKNRRHKKRKHRQKKTKWHKGENTRNLEPPENNGPEIAFFCVQYKWLLSKSEDSKLKDNDNRWKTPDIEINSHVRQFEVSGLKSRGTYKFCVAAVYSNNDNAHSGNSERFEMKMGQPLQSKPPTNKPTIVELTPLDFKGKYGRNVMWQ
ncbi:IHOG-like protein, partial [Mya arenaria]